MVPWAPEPTAQVIHDCFYDDGRPVPMSPRYVLRRVLDLYAAKGWRPVVAPEFEFFLVEPNIDPDFPLKPPIGRSGRPEIGRQAYSIAAVTGSAYDLPFTLPMILADALAMLRGCGPLVDLFGERFVAACVAVKESEHETFARVISSWEREHLLLNV